MINKEKNIQILFFEEIKKSLVSKFTFVDEISDLLNVSQDAAYRRIRGEKLINLEETFVLSKHFGISLDSFVGITENNKIQCKYTPLDLSDINNYCKYLQTISENLNRIKSVPESEIIMTASDIPIFHFYMFNELTFFKLFSWNKSVYGYKKTFEEFVDDFKTDDVLKFYKKISSNYQLIPSTEIWTENSIDLLLKSIEYSYKIGCFKDKRTVLTLCEQLFDIMNKIKDWAENGTKCSKDIQYKLFINETNIDNTFILLKQYEKISCSIKLYTINSLSTSDERFCKETYTWLNNVIQQSTLISGTSAKERYKFFEDQKRKISLLMESCNV